LAGVSKKTVSVALNPKDGKEPRLDYYNGTRKINVNSVKARAFLENIHPSRGKPANIELITKNSQASPEKTEELTDAIIGAHNAQTEKTIEEARLKQQQRIEKELKNAVRRGELIELEAVNQMIMTWFDRWLQANKRGFNSSFDGFMRDAFRVFENERNADKKDFNPHEVTRAGLKRRYSNLFESWADDGKEESIKRLQEIQIEQAKM
jgi:hypothetical protein